MRRGMAALGLVVAMLAPMAAMAQSPTPAPTPPLTDLCLRVRVDPGVTMAPIPLMQAIRDGRLSIEEVVPCATPASPAPSPSAPPAPITTTSPATVFPTPTPKPEPTRRPARAKYEQLGKRAWQKLVRSPDDHYGETIVVWACITQFDAATGDDSFRGDASYRRLAADDYWIDGENSLFTGDAGMLSDFVRDDIVWMRATVRGSFSYDTQAGGNTTVPLFEVDAIKRKGSCD